MKGDKPKYEDLQTVNHYAKDRDVTPQYIHKLVNEGKMDFFIIDGVKFIDTVKFPYIPVTNRRK